MKKSDNLMKNLHLVVRVVLFLIIGLAIGQTESFAQQASVNFGLRILRYNTDGSPQLLTAVLLYGRPQHEVSVSDQVHGLAGDNIRTTTLLKSTASGSYILELSTPTSKKTQMFVVAK
jgi:hypothetical protein